LTELLASGGGTVKSQIPNPKPQIPNPKPQIPSRPSSNAGVQVSKPAAAAPAPPPPKAAPATNPESPSTPLGAGRVPNPGQDPAGAIKDKLLAEIRSKRLPFYNTVVASARRIDVTDDRITFVFGPAHSSLRGIFDQQKTWLDAAAERVAGRRISVTSELSAPAPSDPGSRIPDPGGVPDPGPPAEKKRDLKAEAMSSSTVQAMLEVFPAEIRDVEET